MKKSKAISLEERLLEFVQGGGTFFAGCSSPVPPIVLELAREAGFYVETAEFGFLYIDGRLANSSCPYVLMSSDPREMEEATAWVNCAVHLALKKDTPIADLRKFIHEGREVGRVSLGTFGTLQAGPEAPYDHNKIPRVGQVGLHKDCGGAIRLSTQGPDKLVCTGCGREQVVPPAIYTFADLRRAGRDLP